MSDHVQTFRCWLDIHSNFEFARTVPAAADPVSAHVYHFKGGALGNLRVMDYSAAPHETAVEPSSDQSTKASLRVQPLPTLAKIIFDFGQM
jgi:hypothetical protein